ncbi:hypothetical protein BZA77DRAFT_341416 [Pyronema omphalodes]|nr:hypothetical protein BZA77DRAFT_341416 [Pyronema omphalodes]
MCFDTATTMAQRNEVSCCGIINSPLELGGNYLDEQANKLYKSILAVRCDMVIKMDRSNTWILAMHNSSSFAKDSSSSTETTAMKLRLQGKLASMKKSIAAILLTAVAAAAASKLDNAPGRIRCPMQNGPYCEEGCHYDCVNWLGTPLSLPQDHSHFECSKCSNTKPAGEAVDPGDPAFIATGIVAAPPGPVIVNDLGPIETRAEQGIERTEGTKGTPGSENAFIDNIDPAFIASSVVAAPPGPVIAADLGPIQPRSEAVHSYSESSLLDPNLCPEESTAPQILKSQVASSSKEIPKVIVPCPDPEEKAMPAPSPCAHPAPEEVLDAGDALPVQIHEDVEELAQQIDSVSGDLLPKLEDDHDSDDAIETEVVGEAEEEEEEEEENEEEKPEEDSDSSESDSDSSDTSDSDSDSDSSDSDGEDDEDTKDKKKDDSKVEVDEDESETSSSKTDSVESSEPSESEEAEDDEKDEDKDTIPEPTKTAFTGPQKSLAVECITKRDVQPEDHRHSDPEPNGDVAVARIETAELHRQQAEILAERQKEKEQYQTSGASSLMIEFA